MNAHDAAPAPLPWFKGLFFLKYAPRFPGKEIAEKIWAYFHELRMRWKTDDLKVTDRQIARALHVGRRWVQKGLWVLEHVLGVITRYRTYGEAGGRVVKVVVQLAEKKPAAPPPQSKAAAPTGKVPVPNLQNDRPVTPQQAAQARARSEAAAAGAAAEPMTPEEEAQYTAWWAEYNRGRKQREAEAERRKKAREQAAARPAPKYEPGTPGHEAWKIGQEKQAAGRPTGSPRASPRSAAASPPRPRSPSPASEPPPRRADPRRDDGPPRTAQRRRNRPTDRHRSRPAGRGARPARRHLPRHINRSRSDRPGPCMAHDRCASIENEGIRMMVSDRAYSPDPS